MAVGGFGLIGATISGSVEEKPNRHPSFHPGYNSATLSPLPWRHRRGDIQTSAITPYDTALVSLTFLLNPESPSWKSFLQLKGPLSSSLRPFLHPFNDQ